MDAREEGTTFSPFGLVVAVWFTVLVLSLYGAKHIQDEVAKSEMLSQETWLVNALTHVAQVRESIGLAAIETKLGGLRETINESYTVLAKPIIEEPPPPPPPPVKVGDLVHRVAPRKKRVLVIGASSIQFAIGVELEKRLPTYNGVKVKRFGQLATGLSRPDFMNWPKKLEALASKFKPDLLITNFGGNDAQAIPTGKFEKVEFGTPEWDDEYAERVKEVIRIARKHGAQTVMLGMPVMRSDTFNKKIARLNRVTEQAVREEGELFIPTYEMAATPDGQYRKTITFEGKRGLMRMTDGVHYKRLGARYIVDEVMQILERHFIFDGPRADRAQAVRHTFVSRAGGGDVDYVAYRPDDGGNRAVVMFPGKAWSKWPNHPHRKLQTLAQKHGVTLVVTELDPSNAKVGKELLVDIEKHLEVSPPFGLAAGVRTSTGALALARVAETVDRLSVVGLDAHADLQGLASRRFLLLGSSAAQPALVAAGAPVEVRAPEAADLADGLEATVSWAAAPTDPTPE